MKKCLFSLLLVAGSLFAQTAFAEMVNINKASAAVMQDNLKGIGAKKAEAIISYRTEHGEFKNLEDIKEVKGIGDALFEKIKADISLNEGLSTEGAAGAEGKASTEKKVEAKTAKEDKSVAAVSKESAKKETKVAE